MKKNIVPDEYFNEQEFDLDEYVVDEDKIIGLLGPSPSVDQILKFELCSLISRKISMKEMSYSEVEKITGLNQSDISKIINHHLDRFTIDRLLRTYSFLESPKKIWASLKSISDQIEKNIA